MTEEQEIWDLLDTVPDPEVPVLSVNDLGIVRDIVSIVPKENIEITITPTYSGCPAMDVISMNIRFALLQRGYREVKIKMILAPAWTTAWMTEKGKQKLKAYGIAPPGNNKRNNTVDLFAREERVQCPLCNSRDTSLISEFGSTACKALYKCNTCLEPFDHFKCH